MSNRPETETLPLGPLVEEGLSDLQLALDSDSVSQIASDPRLRISTADLDRCLMLTAGFDSILSIHARRLRVLVAGMLLYRVARESTADETGIDELEELDAQACASLLLGRAVEISSGAALADEAGDEAFDDAENGEAFDDDAGETGADHQAPDEDDPVHDIRDTALDVPPHSPPQPAPEPVRRAEGTIAVPRPGEAPSPPPDLPPPPPPVSARPASDPPRLSEIPTSARDEPQR